MSNTTKTPINPQYRAKRSCMFCENGCKWCQEQPAYPPEVQVWYTPSKSREKANLNVLKGLHPTGAKLHDFDGSRCGNCRHLRAKRFRNNSFYKCAKMLVTAGLSTDIRKKWHGCEHWRLTKHVKHGKVTMVEVL